MPNLFRQPGAGICAAQIPYAAVSSSQMPSSRLIAGYVCLVGLPLALLAMLLGQNWPPAHAVSGGIPLGSLLNPYRTLVQILVILAAARMTGMAARALGQPQVIAETIAGVLLGPSFAGWLFPGFSAAVFPASGLAGLDILSQFGLLLFLFLVGMSLDIDTLREHFHAAILTSHVSIVVPLVLGAGLAWYLYPSLAGTGTGLPVFALFMGAAVSITAFPVLARILSERKLLRSRTGTLAIACAAVDDVTGWCILAYITLLVHKSNAAAPVWLTIAGSLVFAGSLILGTRRLLARLAPRWCEADGALAPVLLFLLVCSLTTAMLGIHMLFGSFLAGVVMPKNDRMRSYLQDRIEPFCVTALMPLFFAFTGVRTDLRLVGAGGLWHVFGLILAVAVAGKLGGATIAARLSGLCWRDAAEVGTLLNTRGLMELVILNIGLELRILTPALFTLMVMMAIVTTMMTGPLLERLRRPTPSIAQLPGDEPLQAVGSEVR